MNLSSRYYFPASVLLLSACQLSPVVVQSPAEPVATVSVPAQAAIEVINSEQALTTNISIESTPDPVSEKVRISVAVVGDLMIGSDYPEPRLPENDGAGYLAAATPILAAADIALGNLEGVLQDGGKAVKTCQNPAHCYLFRSPARYAAHFAKAGFDVMNLANNHARDFGEEGRSSSMKALDEVGIAHTGRVGDVAYIERYGKRIAVIGFAPNIGAHSLNDLSTAETLVRDLALHNDLVFVMFHGGAEGADAERLPFQAEIYQGENRGDVVQFARRLVDVGADAILGSGPHVSRAIEIYKNRLIAYSLGNFATHYGININGGGGVAPLLSLTIEEDGRFLFGKIDSFIQQRPGGPQLDDKQRALNKIRELSRFDFPQQSLIFETNGQFRVPDNLHLK